MSKKKIEKDTIIEEDIIDEEEVKQPTNKVVLAFKIILTIIDIIVYGFLIHSIVKLNLLPLKFILLGAGVLFLIYLTAVILINSEKIIKPVFGVILSILLLIPSTMAINYIRNTDDFLSNSFGNYTNEISRYNVVVLKDSSYNELKDIKDKTIGYVTDESKALKQLQEKVSIANTEYEDIYELYNDLVDKKLEVILLDEAYLEIIEEDIPTVFDDIKIIYSFDIETIIEKEVDEISLRPLNIYISGSDSRSNNIVNKSRSDVNMIVTINPNTREILLTSIPRDYYVQVHGQTGLKDKLTHSGIYGLETSAKTIEDLFDIKIDYSIKVNFNSVVKVVDTVGGIEVYSDRTFKSSHIGGWTVQEGLNYMDGKKALAYARERYAYPEGDRHRIKNQQQVLEITLRKIMSDKSMLLKYDQLLNSLSNLYRTDIPRELIEIFVKDQINDMSPWRFESITVSGKDASMNTHTGPNLKRYVMIPYEDDVKEAHQKIVELYNKK